MAQRVQVLLLCDLHDDEVEGTETVAFGLDGTSFEIDLCNQHATQMRDDVAPFVGSARRAGRAGQGAGRRPSGAGRRANGNGSNGSNGGSGNRGNVSEIRQWARDNGHKVNERGRIASTILDAYEAAH